MMVRLGAPAGLVLLLGLAATASAVVLQVNDTADLPDALPGDGVCATAVATCTLRAAAQEADALAGDDEIDVPAGTFVIGSTIELADTATTIVGSGAAVTILDGAGSQSQIILADNSLGLRGVTVQNGGGVRSLAGSATVSDCTFTGNSTLGFSAGGLGINSGTVTRCTFVGNHADFAGGGLSIGDGEVRDSTFAGNSAGGNPLAIGGDAIVTGGNGTVLIANSTVQGDIAVFSFCTPPPNAPVCIPGTDVVLHNVTGETAHLASYGNPDVGSIRIRNSIMTSCLASGYEIISEGHNLFATSAACTPQPGSGDLVVATLPLLPLADNGGPTMTRLPLPGSAPIDGGADCEATDQRGVGRPIGAACDIGAVEVGCGNGVLDAGEACDDGNLVDGDGCDHNCTVTACGNGVVTAGESCDDGNTTDGDCCDHTCAPEPAGGGCVSDGNVCTDDVCGSNGVCLHVNNAASCDDADACTTGDVCSGGACHGSPTVTCNDPCLACYPDTGCAPHRYVACTSADSGGSTLQVRDAGGAGDKLSWKWKTSAPVQVADFLDPVGGGVSTQLVCVYDGAGAVVARAYPNAGCAGNGCWRSTNDGFAYRDASGAADGVRRIDLKAGPPEGRKARLAVFAKGANLPIVAGGPYTLPLRSVLETSEVTGPFPYTTAQRCFDASFGAHVQRNLAGLFNARSN